MGEGSEDRERATSEGQDVTRPATELDEDSVVEAFEHGRLPAQIAEDFGCDVKDVIDLIIGVYRDEGLTDDEITAQFNENWIGNGP